MSDGTTKISLWLPEQDRIRLAVFGKLLEELGELTARVSRCITHGSLEIDPDTGRENIEEFQREAADVQACLETAYETLGLVPKTERTRNKKAGFARWHDMLREEPSDV